MNADTILNLINRICGEEGDDVKRRGELTLQQELADEGREGLLWACDDLFHCYDTEVVSSSSGIGTSFAASLDNEFSLISDSDVVSCGCVQRIGIVQIHLGAVTFGCVFGSRFACWSQ